MCVFHGTGIGSLGTVVQGPLVALIADYYGWTGMFYLMIILSLLGALAVLRASTIKASITRGHQQQSFNTNGEDDELLVKASALLEGVKT